MATTEPAEAAHVIVHGTAAGFAQRIEIGSHHLDADEPAAFGGTDTGASPYDLLLAALGSCTSMTVGCIRHSLPKVTSRRARSRAGPVARYWSCNAMLEPTQVLSLLKSTPIIFP